MIYLFILEKINFEIPKFMFVFFYKKKYFWSPGENDFKQSCVKIGKTSLINPNILMNKIDTSLEAAFKAIKRFLKDFHYN